MSGVKSRVDTSWKMLARLSVLPGGPAGATITALVKCGQESSGSPVVVARVGAATRCVAAGLVLM